MTVELATPQRHGLARETERRPGDGRAPQDLLAPMRLAQALTLQRVAGNQAVSRLIARAMVQPRQGATAAPTFAGSALVQRDPPAAPAAPAAQGGPAVHVGII